MNLNGGRLFLEKSDPEASENDFEEKVKGYLEVLARDFEIDEEDLGKAEKILEKTGWIPASPQTYAATLVYYVGYEDISKYVRKKTIDRIKERLVRL